MPGAGNQSYPAQQISKYEEENLFKMKRKHLLHFLLVALLIVTFVAVFAISASAETPAETDVYEVLNASGEHVAYAETLDAAKTSMAAGYTLKVLKNATVDLTLDMDYAYNLDATGVTVTGVVAQSKGTVTVKGGTFTTSGETALWTMTGNASLTVEDGKFTNTNASESDHTGHRQCQKSNRYRQRSAVLRENRRNQSQSDPWRRHYSQYQKTCGVCAVRFYPQYHH